MRDTTAPCFFKLVALFIALCGINAQAAEVRGASAVQVVSVATPTIVNVQILSATVKDKRIEGATITLQKNGERSVIGSTNALGQVTLMTPFLDNQSSLMIIRNSGYSNLVVKCPCNGLTYAISPVMNDLDSMRIVLNWGAEPKDLDSHLLFPGNHIYFLKKTGMNALLDVDDTNGYGPETITISRKHDGERYVYAVHNFTDGRTPGSDRLSKSDAKVFVYVGQTLIKTYYVPTNVNGNLWTVFAVTGAGDFQDINSVSGVTGNVRIETANLQSAVDHTQVQTVSSSTINQENSIILNRQGEAAYHSGNLDESIRLYQSAIELDGNYSQAYSNIGLAFQKVGRIAEALWANRKAIALASGSTAATVRASSHFNNGKIYETAGQWPDALREYQYARDEKLSATYDKAIERMQLKVVQ